MRHLLRLFLIGVTALAVGDRFAEAAQVITLKDALDTALHRNIDLRRAQVDARLGDVGVREAWEPFLPNLEADAAGARNYGQNFSQSEGRIINQTNDSLSLSASSGLKIFNGFHDFLGLRQARFQRAAGYHDLDRAAQTTVFTVTSDFVTLLLRQEQLHVLRDNLSDEAHLREQIQQYVTAGARSASDLYQQEANVAAARVAVVQAENAVESAQTDLVDTLLLDPSAVYDFHSPADLNDTASFAVPEVSVLMNTALARRADIKAAEARLDAAEQGVGVARAGWWPTLSLQGTYGSAFSNASDAPFNDQIRDQRGGAVTLGLTIPLFEGGATRNASHRARLELLRQQIALEEVRQTVGVEVRRVRQDYLSAQEQFSAAQAQQQTAERAVRAAEERFKSGVAPLVELTQARIIFLQAKSSLATARNNLLFQHTSLDYALGNFDRQTPRLE
jgi:outer membrane protein